MKQLKRISLWRRIAIVLCFVLAIGAGVAGALIPQMNGAFAEDEARAATSINVAWMSGSLEKNVTPAEVDQLKKYLRVTDQDGNEVPAADYTVAITYVDADTSATITVTCGSLTPKTVSVPVEAAKYQGLKVSVPKTIDGKPVSESDGYYQFSKNHLIYFTDMEPQDVLDKLEVSIQYQHVSKRITYTKSSDDKLVFTPYERDGLQVTRLLVNNNSFEVGTQSVDVTVAFSVSGDLQSATASTSIKFAERKVVDISPVWSGGTSVNVYDDLRDSMTVTAIYNDGKTATLDKSAFNVSTLFPKKTDITNWNATSFSYERSVTVRYAFDERISKAVMFKDNNNENKTTITVNAIEPYFFTSLSGKLPVQTADGEWDFTDMAVGVVYSKFDMNDTIGGEYVTETYTLSIPLYELDPQFLYVTYKSTATSENKTLNLRKDSKVPADISNPSSISIQFIYNEGANLINATTEISKRDNSGPMRGMVTAKLAGDWYTWQSNHLEQNFAFTYDEIKDSGDQTYNRPSLDTKAKYLVDVEGKAQPVTLDYQLRANLKTIAVEAATAGKNVEEEIAKKFVVKVTGADGTEKTGVWQADYENEEYSLLFSKTDFYNIEFTLVNDVWESGKKTISYTIPVQKRYLDVTYGSTSGGSVSGDFSVWITSLDVNFYNRDNGAIVTAGLPAFEIFMYSSEDSTKKTRIGYNENGGKAVKWENTTSFDGDDKKGIYFIYTSFGATDYYYGSEQSAFSLYQVNLGQTHAEPYQRNSVQKVIANWEKSLKRTGATDIKLYEYDGNATNKKGEVKSADPTNDTTRLHAGSYTVEYMAKGSASTSYDTIIITPVSYQAQYKTLEDGFAYDGAGITEAKQRTLATAAGTGLGIYPELDASKLQIVAGATTTDRLDSVKDVGSYQACFATKVADGDLAGDYNLPVVYLNFDITPVTLSGLKLMLGTESSTDGAISTTYTGGEITFNFNDGGDKWEDRWKKIYAENLTITMKSATLPDNGGNINAAFYFVNDEKSGNVTVALAGEYVVTVRFNQNIVSGEFKPNADGSQERVTEKDFTITVGKATLQVNAADGSGTITQESTTAKFALATNKLDFTSTPVTADVANATAKSNTDFRPLMYTVYNGDQDVTNQLLTAGTYKLVITSMTANNYRYPRDGGLLADFTYMVNYNFTAKEFNLTITAARLGKLEFKEDLNITGEERKTVTVTYEKDRVWNVLDFFKEAAGVGAYTINVTATAGNVSGADGLYQLDAGAYDVTIDAKTGSGVWDEPAGAGKVDFTLVVEKATIELAVPSIFRGTYNGKTQSALLGGAQSYWKDLKDKGVTAKVIDSAGKESEVNIYTESPLSFGAYSVTNAGVYNIVFSVGATNYTFSGIESSVANGFCVTNAVSVAEIARMQITAPALETARLTQTGTARTLPEAFTTKFTIEQDNIIVTYKVEYATAGALQGGSHEHGDFGTTRPANDDSTQGMYAICLTITGDNATNFAWARNAADIDYISYTNAYDIQGFENNTHVAILHYVTVTQKLDITCNTAQSFYYGGYLGTDNTKMPNLAGYMFSYERSELIPEGTEYSYYYLDASGNVLRTATGTYNKDNQEYTVTVTGGSKTDFTTWDAGMYVGRVTLTFPDGTEYLPLSFNVAITVEKLPVALVLSGNEKYGEDQSNYSPTVAYAGDSKHFLGVTGIPVSFTTAIDKTTSAGTYGAEMFTLNPNAGGVDYSKNYNITYTASYEVTKAPITLTVGTGKSNYGEDINYYLMLGTVATRNGDEITDAVTARVSKSDVSYSNGRLNAGTYRVDFEAVENGNYKVTFTGNAYNDWTVEKIQAEVKIDISLFYGETVKTDVTAPATGGGIYTVTYSNMLAGDPATPAGVNGKATFTVSNGNVKYVSGLTSTNYFFEEVSQGTATGDSHGRVSYKPLDVTVTIGNTGGEYYKPKVLPYTLTVNSASSYGEGTVELSDTIKEELGGVEGTDGTYTFEMWSQGIIGVEFGTGVLAKAFVITTGAYDKAPENGTSGATANAGTYAIVGMANPEFAENYSIAFKGEQEGSKAGVYTVNQVGGNDKFLVSTDPGDVEKNPDKIVIIIKPARSSTQQTRSKAAASLAATIADGEEANSTTLPYDETYRTLLTADVSGVQDGYTVLYNVVKGANPTAPSKDSAGWTSVPPMEIDAGIYTIYYYVKMASPNYADSDIFHFTVTITQATNEVATAFNFSNGKVFGSADAATEKKSAWVYGLYSESATNGFNIMGDQRITEFVAKYQRGATINVLLYAGEETEAVYTAGSATAVFNYMFNNSAGERFNAGAYRLVFTVTAGTNSNGETNYSNLTATYYFTVAKRDIKISAAGATVVYGEDATGLTATVTGLVRNNYDANETAINPTALYTLTVSGYSVGDDVGTMGTVTVTLADNIDELLDGNYNTPTTESGTLNVVKRRVVITIGDKGSTYGDENPNNEFSAKYANTNIAQNIYAPLANHTLVTLKVDVTNNKVTSTTNAGTYPIYAVWNKISESGTDTYEKNYEMVFVNCSYGEKLNVTEAIGTGDANKAGTYTVNKKIINVIWDGESGDSFVYNGEPLTFTAKAEDVEQIDSNPVLIISYAMKDKANGEFKPLANDEKPTNAGDYKISAEFNSNKYPNYTTGGSSITITITKATATVTAKDASVVYGNELSAGTGYDMTIALPKWATEKDTKEWNDLEGKDQYSSYSVFTDREGKVSYEAGTTGVGSYQIVINTDTVKMDNFELVPVAGVFTVTKRNVTVAFKKNLETEYSGKYVTQAYINNTLVKNHENEIFEVTNDWKTPHDWDALDIVLSVENALNAIEGGYTITPSSSSENYNVKFSSVGKLIITKKALTVWATATVVYGEELTADKVEFAFGKLVDGKEVNNFVKGEDYASLLAISNAMGADAANNPIIGQLTSNYSDCGYSTDTPVSNTNLTITPSAAESNGVFLNYDIKEFVAGAITILRKPITATGKAVTYNPNGYEGIVFADIAGVRAEDAEAFKVVYDLSNLMNEGKSVDCGTYSVTVTLESSEAADPPIAQNYTFGDSNSDPVTNTTVSIEIVQQVIHVGWNTDSYTVDFSDGVAHTVYLDEKFANGFNTLFRVASFVRNFYNEDERVWDTQEDIDIITGSDGRCYFVINDTSSAKVNGIGEYVLTLQLKDSVNYRWQNPVSAGSDKYQLISINATTNKVTVGITANDVEYTKPLDIEVTVDVGSVRNVTYIYFTNDSQDAETQYNALKALATIDNEALEQYGFTQIDATVTPEPVNAGYYVVLAQYVSSDGSRSGSAYAAFKISPLAVSAPTIHGYATQAYNGSALTFEVTGFEESFMTFTAPDGMVGTTVGNTVRFTATDAETYKVEFKLSDNNHVWAEGAQTTISFTVEKSEQTIALNDVYTFAYGDEIQIAPTFKFATDDAVLLYYAYGNADNPQGESLGSTLPSSAGVYYVVVSDNGTDNYDGASKGAIIVVTKKEVKVSITVNVPYGQTVVAGDINYTLTGLVSGETENDYVTVNLAALASGLAFGEGAGIKNVGRYNPVFATAQTVINAYTGDTANGLVGFAKRGVADNYYFTADDNSIVIVNKLAVSVVIGNASGTFGSSPQFNSGITLRWADSVGNNNIPAADRTKQDADLMELLGVTASSFYCTANNASDVGSYPIKVTRWSSDNYNVTFVDGSFEVLPANIFVEWTTGGGSYGAVTEPEITKLSVLLNGSLQDVTSTTFGQNAISKLSFLFTDTTGVQLFEAGQIPENAGEYYVELVFAADGKIGQNYTLSLSSAAQRRFSIGKLVIEVEDVRVDYGDDGMKLTYKNGEAVVPTLVANEELNKYFEITRVDDAKTVGTYYMTLTLNDFTNVQWSIGRTAEYRLAFNVTKARNHIVGSIQMEGWTYGDEAKTPSVTLANDKDISDGVEIKPVFEYSANNGADWTTVVPTAAGSYLVRATANGTTNVDAFASPSATPFTIARKAIAKPQIEITMANNTFTGSVLLANVSGFDQSLMMFDYVGNFTVDGNSIALTALNAGTYTLTITLTNSNYMWADNDENLVYEQAWTVAPKRLEKPTEGKNSFVVNGGIIKYLPEGFDDVTMKITGNEEGHGGTFKAEISIIDPANYVWDDGTVDAIQIEWTIVGINTVFKALMGVLGSIAGLAVVGGAAQFVLNKRKQKREAEMDGSEEQTGEESEGGKQA